MGQFSWICSDTKEPLYCEGKIGRSGYLLLPDGGYIYEPNYDGYGEFNGQDVYELVVDWNLKYIDKNFLKFCISDKLIDKDDWNKVLEYVSEGRINDINELVNNEFWKRNVGIDLACGDRKNEHLPFPIKITRTKCNYNDVPPSKVDPNQGWNIEYDDEDEY